MTEGGIPGWFFSKLKKLQKLMTQSTRHDVQSTSKKAWPRAAPLRMSNNVKLSSGTLKGLEVSLCVNEWASLLLFYESWQKTYDSWLRHRRLFIHTKKCVARGHHDDWLSVLPTPPRVISSVYEGCLPQGRAELQNAGLGTCTNFTVRRKQICWLTAYSVKVPLSYSSVTVLHSSHNP